MSRYDRFKGTELWKKIDEILAELEDNQDITLTTVRDYVIGYFCEQISTSSINLTK